MHDNMMRARYLRNLMTVLLTEFFQASVCIAHMVHPSLPTESTDSVVPGQSTRSYYVDMSHNFSTALTGVKAHLSDFNLVILPSRLPFFRMPFTGLLVGDGGGGLCEASLDISAIFLRAKAEPWNVRLTLPEEFNTM